VPRYLVELYVSRAGAADLADASGRARAAAEALTREGTPVEVIRSIFVPDDETCFYLFDAASAAAVEEAAARAGIRFGRIAQAELDA